MSNDKHPTRRTALKRLAAVPLAASAVVSAQSVSATALVEAEAELKRIKKVIDTAIDEEDRLYAEYRSLAPPRPENLYWRSGDVLERAVGIETEMRPDGTASAFFGPLQIEKLRRGSWKNYHGFDRMRAAGAWDGDEQVELRAEEILAAHDRWLEEQEALAERIGCTGATQRLEDANGRRDTLLELARMETPARTLADLCIKARLLRDYGFDDEDVERFLDEFLAFTPN